VADAVSDAGWRCETCDRLHPWSSGGCDECGQWRPDEVPFDLFARSRDEGLETAARWLEHNSSKTGRAAAKAVRSLKSEV
jgi:predicted ATP-dependent serine protease